MAEVASETVVPVQAEDTEFSFDAATHEGNPEDDFDFDLGHDDDKALEQPGGAEEHDFNDLVDPIDPVGPIEPVAATAPVEELKAESHHEEADDEDKISYEEGGVPLGDENAEENEPKHEDADEIDYEDVDLTSAALHEDLPVLEEKPEEHVAEESHNGIDFGFETSEAPQELSEHDDGADDDDDDDDVDTSFRDAHDQDADEDDEEEEEEEEEVEADEAEEEADEADDADDADDADEEAEEEEEDGETDEADYIYDEDEDEDDANNSPGGSLNAGLGQLHSLAATTSTADVTVTWGDEVCPLFKASEGDNPNSFFLEDREAINYPLSKFLQTVRSGIASWVHAGDEIFIRIDDLGFEFGETTTEALLHQVTFHNLLALHNTLLTNDDATAARGLHITLGTRPNCLLRLKELVGGAGLGKGLSAFQHATSSSDDSSEEENDDDSDELSHNDGTIDIAEGEKESASTPEADMVDLVQSSVDDDTFGGEGANLTAAEEDAESAAHGMETEEREDHGAGAVDEEVDFIDYTHEEEEAAGGALLDTAGESSIDHATTDAAGQVANEIQQEYAEEHADEHVEQIDEHVHIDEHVEHVEPVEHTEHTEQAVEGHHDDLDLLGGLDPVGGDTAHEQDGHTLEHLDPENGLESIGHDHQQEMHNEDDFLDLSGDMEEAAAPTELPELPELPEETSSKTVEEELEASLDTSATLDHDEIDYEELDMSAPVGSAPTEETLVASSVLPIADGDTSAVLVAAVDAGLDEIDWDEDKNGVSLETVSTPTTGSGKRTRDEESLDDELAVEFPDVKRHRTGDTPV